MPSCSTYHLTWVSLTLGMGLLLPVAALASDAGQLLSAQCAGCRRHLCLMTTNLYSKDTSLLYFYLHVNSQIGSFQKKTTSSVIRLGCKDGACPSLYTLKTTKINGFIRLVISLCHSVSMVLKSGSLNQVCGHHLGTWAHADPQRRGPQCVFIKPLVSVSGLQTGPLP